MRNTTKKPDNLLEKILEWALIITVAIIITIALLSIIVGEGNKGMLTFLDL